MFHQAATDASGNLKWYMCLDRLVPEELPTFFHFYLPWRLGIEKKLWLSCISNIPGTTRASIISRSPTTLMSGRLVPPSQTHIWQEESILLNEQLCCRLFSLACTRSTYTPTQFVGTGRFFPSCETWMPRVSVCFKCQLLLRVLLALWWR